jgi:hypothetical protein
MRMDDLCDGINEGQHIIRQTQVNYSNDQMKLLLAMREGNNKTIAYCLRSDGYHRIQRSHRYEHLGEVD